MKVCPKCGSVSADDQQKFCLMDGSVMVAADSEPTVVIPPAISTPTVAAISSKRKRSPFIWVGVALLLVLVGGSLLVALLIYSYRLGNQSAKNEKPANANLSARTTSTPVRPAIQSTPLVVAGTETSPSASPETSYGDSDEEATPITWTTAASGLKQDTGRTYKFLCPPEGTSAMIWGVDVYTADSSICTAAVHAGIITLEKGGEVTIEFRPGRQIYGSTTRNGITSSTYGEYPHSFIVR